MCFDVLAWFDRVRTDQITNRTFEWTLCDRACLGDVMIRFAFAAFFFDNLKCESRVCGEEKCQFNWNACALPVPEYQFALDNSTFDGHSSCRVTWIWCRMRHKSIAGRPTVFLVHCRRYYWQAVMLVDSILFCHRLIRLDFVPNNSVSCARGNFRICKKQCCILCTWKHLVWRKSAAARVDAMPTRLTQSTMSMVCLCQCLHSSTMVASSLTHAMNYCWPWCSMPIRDFVDRSYAAMSVHSARNRSNVRSIRLRATDEVWLLPYFADFGAD